MKWIKVSDKLPDDSSVVLVVCVHGYDKASYITTAAYYDNDDPKWIECDCCSASLNVTHWMKLPDKPKDDE